MNCIRFSLFSIILLVLLTACEREQKQPPLTANEKSYFTQLKNACNCDIERAIDTRGEKKRPKFSTKPYSISFVGIKENEIKNYDSLKDASFEVAKHLHKNILNKDFNYPYNQILVFYFCPDAEDDHVSDVFKYEIEALK